MISTYKIGDKVRLIGGHIVGYQDDENEDYTFKIGDIFEVVENVGKGCWIEKGFVELGINEGFFEIADNKSVEKKSALDVQEGGGHYKWKGIQPVEYAYRNNLGFIESNVVKYVSRWKEKNGIQDLKKARHYLDILIEFEEQKEYK